MTEPLCSPKSDSTQNKHKRQSLSILKPLKARCPLQDLDLLPNTEDDTTTTTFTAMRRRRVSFAGVNQVKEFHTAAESLTVHNTPAYDEPFTTTMSSDSSSNHQFTDSKLSEGTVMEIVSNTNYMDGSFSVGLDAVLDLTVKSNELSQIRAPLRNVNFESKENIGNNNLSQKHDTFYDELDMDYTDVRYSSSFLLKSSAKSQNTSYMDRSMEFTAAIPTRMDDENYDDDELETSECNTWTMKSNKSGMELTEALPGLYSTTSQVESINHAQNFNPIFQCVSNNLDNSNESANTSMGLTKALSQPLIECYENFSRETNEYGNNDVNSCSQKSGHEFGEVNHLDGSEMEITEAIPYDNGEFSAYAKSGIVSDECEVFEGKGGIMHGSSSQKSSLSNVSMDESTLGESTLGSGMELTKAIPGPHLKPINHSSIVTPDTNPNEISNGRDGSMELTKVITQTDSNSAHKLLYSSNTNSVSNAKSFEFCKEKISSHIDQKSMENESISNELRLNNVSGNSEQIFSSQGSCMEFTKAVPIGVKFDDSRRTINGLSENVSLKDISLVSPDKPSVNASSTQPVFLASRKSLSVESFLKTAPVSRNTNIQSVETLSVYRPTNDKSFPENPVDESACVPDAMHQTSVQSMDSVKNLSKVNSSRKGRRSELFVPYRKPSTQQYTSENRHTLPENVFEENPITNHCEGNSAIERAQLKLSLLHKESSEHHMTVESVEINLQNNSCSTKIVAGQNSGNILTSDIVQTGSLLLEPKFESESTLESVEMFSQNDENKSRIEKSEHHSFLSPRKSLASVSITRNVKTSLKIDDSESNSAQSCGNNSTMEKDQHNLFSKQRKSLGLPLTVENAKSSSLRICDSEKTISSQNSEICSNIEITQHEFSQRQKSSGPERNFERVETCVPRSSDLDQTDSTLKAADRSNIRKIQEPFSSTRKSFGLHLSDKNNKTGSDETGTEFYSSSSVSENLAKHNLFSNSFIENSFSKSPNPAENRMVKNSFSRTNNENSILASRSTSVLREMSCLPTDVEITENISSINCPSIVKSQEFEDSLSIVRSNDVFKNENFNKEVNPNRSVAAPAAELKSKETDVSYNLAYKIEDSSFFSKSTIEGNLLKESASHLYQVPSNPSQSFRTQTDEANEIPALLVTDELSVNLQQLNFNDNNSSKTGFTEKSFAGNFPPNSLVSSNRLMNQSLTNSSILLKMPLEISKNSTIIKPLMNNSVFIDVLDKSQFTLPIENIPRSVFLTDPMDDIQCSVTDYRAEISAMTVNKSPCFESNNSKPDSEVPFSSLNENAVFELPAVSQDTNLSNSVSVEKLNHEDLLTQEDRSEENKSIESIGGQENYLNKSEGDSSYPAMKSYLQSLEVNSADENSNENAPNETLLSLETSIDQDVLKNVTIYRSRGKKSARKSRCFSDMNDSITRSHDEDIKKVRISEEFCDLTGIKKLTDYSVNMTEVSSEGKAVQNQVEPSVASIDSEFIEPVVLKVSKKESSRHNIMEGISLKSAALEVQEDSSDLKADDFNLSKLNDEKNANAAETSKDENMCLSTSKQSKMDEELVKTKEDVKIRSFLDDSVPRKRGFVKNAALLYDSFVSKVEPSPSKSETEACERSLYESFEQNKMHVEEYLEDVTPTAHVTGVSDIEVIPQSSAGELKYTPEFSPQNDFEKTGYLPNLRDTSSLVGNVSCGSAMTTPIFKTPKSTLKNLVFSSIKGNKTRTPMSSSKASARLSFQSTPLKNSELSGISVRKENVARSTEEACGSVKKSEPFALMNSTTNEMSPAENALYSDFLERLKAETRSTKDEWNLIEASRDCWSFEFLAVQVKLCINFDAKPSNVLVPVKNIILSRIDSCQAEPQNFIGQSILLQKYPVSRLISSCKNSGCVFDLLHLISCDVIFIKKVIKSLKRIYLAEYNKTFISFTFERINPNHFVDISLDLSSWDSLAPSSVNVLNVIGNLRETRFQSLFEESGKDPDCIRKFYHKCWEYMESIPEVK